MRGEQAIVAEFIGRRPTMAQNNREPASMVRLLTAEVNELLTEIEAGDVTKIAQESSDVVWFVLTIATLYGIDMEDAFWAKAIRNEHKYPEEYFTDGMSYEEASTLCRALWNRDNDNNFVPDKI